MFEVSKRMLAEHADKVAFSTITDQQGHRINLPKMMKAAFQ